MLVKIKFLKGNTGKGITKNESLFYGDNFVHIIISSIFVYKNDISFCFEM
jgi:hypothetical protein